MKVSDILQRYQNGQRNFQGLNLQGANFAGKDLSGADFSQCDIRGANFKGATLIGVNFSGAKAGLTIIGMILTFIVTVVLITFSAVLSVAIALAFAGVFFIAFLGAKALAVALAFIVALAISSVGIIAGAIAFATAGVITETFPHSISVSWYHTLKNKTRYLWLRHFSLAIAAFGGTSFYQANLTDADFTGATLKNTNFSLGILTRTCFKETIKLNLASVSKTILANPTVRDLLINPSNGEGINLFKANLRGAYLQSANLQAANLTQADISEATLQYANLKDANLTQVNAVNTNFGHVLLTGACIEAWNIDSTTLLDNIDCQYVYFLNGKKERRPSYGDFQAGEFSKRLKQVLDTVILIFHNKGNTEDEINYMKQHLDNEDEMQALLQQLAQSQLIRLQQLINNIINKS
ncbi:MAG: pentapeptide repeat-containing protein [Microcystaceae cyanobacterium]